MAGSSSAITTEIGYCKYLSPSFLCEDMEYTLQANEKCISGAAQKFISDVSLNTFKIMSLTNCKDVKNASSEKYFLICLNEKVEEGKTTYANTI